MAAPIHSTYPVPGKIEGDHRLDFLLPSFLSSRKEKKIRNQKTKPS